ncbi:AfsR/SARP family transcriptional regulator [Micromonospora sp. NPDC049060]|uniref:AfsR/SARP family transcriptional regulator n=1 Tax=Micromonospora sp. NPDC049060 TaxID=3154828 RepID=UPI003400F9EC
MEIRLLGPVEACCGGVRLELGPRQQRFLLAVLALETNRLVPTDRLIDLTWPAGPPRTARHAVQVSVSRLRATLRAAPTGGSVEVLSRADGYLLAAHPHLVDAHLFRALVRQAHTTPGGEARARLLRRALSLWRGPALAGTGPPETVDGLVRGLTEERLTAQEERMDAELDAGNHIQVLGGLLELVARHPYRQRFVAQLMIAQHRCGLTADALATYRRTRSALAREMGLDPGVRLRRLEQAILRGDPELEPATRTAAVR